MKRTTLIKRNAKLNLMANPTNELVKKKEEEERKLMKIFLDRETKKGKCVM